MFNHAAINLKEVIEIDAKIRNRIKSGVEETTEGFRQETFGRLIKIQEQLPEWMKAGLFYLGQNPDGRGFWLWDGEICHTYEKVMCSRCRRNQLVGVAGAHYHIWHCVYCQSSDVSGLYVETGDFFD